MGTAFPRVIPTEKHCIIKLYTQICMTYTKVYISINLTEASMRTVLLVLNCIVSCIYIHLYSASGSAHQSEALSVRETQREESSLERTKRGTWLTS